jgi:hypothetical protein
LQGKIDGEFAAMRTAHQDGAADAAFAQKRGKVVDFGIQLQGGRRAAVSAPVVMQHVILLALQNAGHTASQTAECAMPS